MTRIEKIRQRLITAFTPTHLEIIDDSHKHIGHAGVQGGAGHFTIVISSPIFSDKSKVISHRLIYDTLKDMMGTEIHALSIKLGS